MIHLLMKCFEVDLCLPHFSMKSNSQCFAHLMWCGYDCTYDCAYDCKVTSGKNIFSLLPLLLFLDIGIQLSMKMSRSIYLPSIYVFNCLSTTFSCVYFLHLRISIGQKVTKHLFTSNAIRFPWKCTLSAIKHRFTFGDLYRSVVD